MQRLEGRERRDDTEVAIRRRLAQFKTQTLPAVETYRQRGLLKEVDGLGRVEEVAQRIRKVIPWR